MKKIIDYTKILVLAAILVVGVSYLKAWTGPTLPAPTGNTAAPINTGSGTQTKNGSLTLNAGVYGIAPNQWQNAIGLTVFGTSTLYGLTLANGSQGLNKVLVSDAYGNAKWVAASTVVVAPVRLAVSGSFSINEGVFSTINIPDTGAYTLGFSGSQDYICTSSMLYTFFLDGGSVGSVPCSLLGSNVRTGVNNITTTGGSHTISFVTANVVKRPLTVNWTASPI
jgi:hypothetical protein